MTPADTFVTVKPSALSPEAKEALALATDQWRRIPARAVHLASDLERMGLVKMRIDWQWSTRHSGAGRHVAFWRLKGEQ